jgi:hypothetical protein
MGKRQFSLTVIQAARDTVKAYQNLIANPHTISNWAGYGYTDSCRLCRAVGQADKGKPLCGQCPLDSENAEASSMNCSSTDTFNQLEQLIRRKNLPPEHAVIQAATDRLAWIMKTFLEYGLDLDLEHKRELARIKKASK